MHNFGSFNGPTVLEHGFFPNATVEALHARGHNVCKAICPAACKPCNARLRAGWVLPILGVRGW